MDERCRLCGYYPPSNSDATPQAPVDKTATAYDKTPRQTNANTVPAKDKTERKKKAPEPSSSTLVQAKESEEKKPKRNPERPRGLCSPFDAQHQPSRFEPYSPVLPGYTPFETLVVQIDNMADALTREARERLDVAKHWVTYEEKKVELAVRKHVHLLECVLALRERHEDEDEDEDEVEEGDHEREEGEGRGEESKPQT